MARRLFPLLLLISSLVPLSLEAGDDLPTFTGFVQCMERNTFAGDNIRNLIVFRGNSSFSSTLQAYIRNPRFNTDTTPKPLLIVTAKQISHLQATVICAQQAAPGYILKIRSGGHDYDGLSYTSTSPFLMVDMFNLRSIAIDKATQTAWVQAGATVGELYYNIWKTSNLLAFPAGLCPTVGIGGHLSGGGYGTLLRKYGLSVDNVVDAQVVDAQGRLLNRTTMGEDFFWALRGGGGASFGIVVAYKINLVDVPAKVTVFRVEQLVENNATAMLYEWQKVAPAISNDLFMRVLLQQAYSKKEKDQMTIRVTVMAMYLGAADSLVQLLGNKLPSLGLTKSDCKEMTWIQSALWWANYDPATTSPEALLDRDINSTTYLKRKSDYVTTPISVTGLNSLFEKMISVGKIGLVFNAYGGKMSEIASADLPFPHRSGNLFKIQYSENWNDAGRPADEDNINRSRQLYSFMTPYVSQNPRRAYINYRDVDIGVMPPGANLLAVGRSYGEMYFNGNFDRLVKVKTAVDPKNFFRYEQSIPTLSPTKSSDAPGLLPVLLLLPVLQLLDIYITEYV